MSTDSDLGTSNLEVGQCLSIFVQILEPSESGREPTALAYKWMKLVLSAHSLSQVYDRDADPVNFSLLGVAYV